MLGDIKARHEGEGAVLLISRLKLVAKYVCSCEYAYRESSGPVRCKYLALCGSNAAMRPTPDGQANALAKGGKPALDNSDRRWRMT